MNRQQRRALTRQRSKALTRARKDLAGWHRRAQVKLAAGEDPHAEFAAGLALKAAIDLCEQTQGRGK